MMSLMFSSLVFLGAGQQILVHKVNPLLEVKVCGQDGSQSDLLCACEFE